MNIEPFGRSTNAAENFNPQAIIVASLPGLCNAPDLRFWNSGPGISTGLSLIASHPDVSSSMGADSDVVDDDDDADSMSLLSTSISIGCFGSSTAPSPPSSRASDSSC